MLQEESSTCTPTKSNMTMEHPSFEDVFPIEHGGFSNVMLVFRGVYFPNLFHVFFLF